MHMWCIHLPRLLLPLIDAEEFWGCADVRVINASATLELDEPEVTATRRRLPPWEDLVTVSDERYGTPRAYRMSGAGWNGAVMEIALNPLQGRRRQTRRGLGSGAQRP